MEDIKSYMNNLSVDEKDALLWYINNRENDILDILNRYTVDDLSNDHPFDIIKYNFKIISKIFMNAPILPESLIVYRTIKAPNNTESFLNNNGVVNMISKYSNKKFISTSLDFNVAKSFLMGSNNGCVLKILVPAGTKILPLQDISRYPEEKEVLLNKDCELVINELIENNDTIIVRCVYVKGVKIESDMSVLNFIKTKRHNTINRITTEILKNETKDVINNLFNSYYYTLFYFFGWSDKQQYFKNYIQNKYQIPNDMMDKILYNITHISNNYNF